MTVQYTRRPLGALLALALTVTGCSIADDSELTEEDQTAVAANFLAEAQAPAPASPDPAGSLTQLSELYATLSAAVSDPASDGVGVARDATMFPLSIAPPPGASLLGLSLDWGKARGKRYVWDWNVAFALPEPVDVNPDDPDGAKNLISEGYTGPLEQMGFLATTTLASRSETGDSVNITYVANDDRVKMGNIPALWNLVRVWLSDNVGQPHGKDGTSGARFEASVETNADGEPLIPWLANFVATVPVSEGAALSDCTVTTTIENEEFVIAIDARWTIPADERAGLQSKLSPDGLAPAGWTAARRDGDALIPTVGTEGDGGTWRIPAFFQDRFPAEFALSAGNEESAQLEVKMSVTSRLDPLPVTDAPPTPMPTEAPAL
ncbi:MAG: hypothetical protein KAZ88_10930 [Acidimicrobiia bacterium]|nr:hypothetical protein [Acidimicrobiia bacterium]